MSFRTVAGLLLSVAVGISCTAPSAPSYVTAEFVLTDVDGHGLPASSPPALGLPGSTLIGAYMSLDQSGAAYIAEDRISQTTRYDMTTPYLYGVSGSRIKFDYANPCP